MLGCADTARKQGVMALQEFAKEQGNDFLEFALMLVIDGTDPMLVKGILETLIDAGNHSGGALLGRLIIAEGVLSVQVGENPRILEIKLLCMLGEDFLKQRGLFPPRARDYFNEMEIDRRLTALTLPAPPPEFDEFNKTLRTMSRYDIQQTLKEVPTTDLAIALKGCGSDVAQKLCSSISGRIALIILDDAELMQPSTSEILAIHEKILSVVKRLNHE
jgi:hypothetical protein